MKHTFYILYRIHFIFIFLITYLFLLSCQQKKNIEPGKPDDIAFTKTYSANSSGKKKIQEMKADQKIYPNKGNNNVRHSTNNGCRKITEQEKSAYHTPESVSYPSGEIALEEFLGTNNLYNSTKYYESIDGIVYLKLLIDTTGKVIGKNIVRGIGLGIDEEALRLASLLEFNPAKDSTGNVMLSVYILKIKFEKHPYPIVIIDGVTAKISDQISNKNTSWHFKSKADAQYPGGRLKMQRFFRKNMHYSPDNEHSIKGRVKMILEIDEIGKLVGVTVYESTEPDFTEEAIRLVRLVKKWKPATVRHRYSSGYMRVTIKFKISHKSRNQTKNNAQ